MGGKWWRCIIGECNCIWLAFNGGLKVVMGGRVVALYYWGMQLQIGRCWWRCVIGECNCRLLDAL